MAAKIRIRGHVPRNELIETQKRTKDARLYRNIEMVLFAYDGLSATKIANRINCSPATVCGWIRSWNEQGLDGLTPNFGGGRPSYLTEEEQKSVLEWIGASIENIKENGGVLTIRDVQSYIKERYGVEYTYCGIWRLCRERWGLKLIKPYSHDYRKPKDAEGILKKE